MANTPQPFYVSRDPSIAQSIYNLGHAYLGPDARRRDAQDALEAEVAGARIRNLDSDTGFNTARATGQNMTNDNRARRFAAAKARGYDDLTALLYAGSENSENDAKAGYLASGQQQRDKVEVVNIEGRFAGERNAADNTRALQQTEREGFFAGHRNDADNTTRIRLAQMTPVVASDGSTVLFAPNDPRIPAVAPSERPAPVIQPGPAAGVVPTLPPAVPPPQPPAAAPQPAPAPSPAPATPGTLGNAFATQGQAPVVQGNTVRVPANPSAGRQADPLAEEAKRVALFKSRTDARADVSAALASRLQSIGVDPADLDPGILNGVVDVAVRNAEASGFQTDATSALGAAFTQLGLGPQVEDGWLWDTTTLGRNGQALDANGVQALIRDTLPKVSADAAGKAMFDRLPSGTRFLDPNGIERIKP